MDSHTDSVLNRLDVVDTGRRRRWSDGEKERIARSQLLAWRRAMLVEPSAAPSGFIPMLVTPETDEREDARMMGAGAPPALAVVAPTPGRIEIVLRSGRRMVVEGAADMDAVLKLARGLEAFR